MGAHTFIGFALESMDLVHVWDVINWSERSACDQPSNLGRPLFLVINLFFFSFLAPVVKIPEEVVVGFRNFAWAPN